MATQNASDLAQLNAAQDEIEDFVFALAERMGLSATLLSGAMIWALATVVAHNTTDRSARDEVVQDIAATLRGAIRSAYVQLDQAEDQMEAMCPAGRA